MGLWQVKPVLSQSQLYCHSRLDSGEDRLWAPDCEHRANYKLEYVQSLEVAFKHGSYVQVDARALCHLIPDITDFRVIV